MKNLNRAWKNKRNNKLFLARAYWECPEPDEELSKLLEDGSGYEPCKVGTLYQAGWLIRNWDGCYFVIPMELKSEFEDLGEATEEHIKEMKKEESTL